jgi:hypothetical protein
MVSKFKYDTPKTINAVKEHPVKTIIVILSVILIIATKGRTFAFCLFYISMGIFRSTKEPGTKIFSARR